MWLEVGVRVRVGLEVGVWVWLEVEVWVGLEVEMRVMVDVSIVPAIHMWKKLSNYWYSFNYTFKKFLIMFYKLQ